VILPDRAGVKLLCLYAEAAHILKAYFPTFLRIRIPSPIVPALLLLTLVSACGIRSEDKPLIFAAASLSDVLTEASELYEQQTGSSVMFSFGGSTALANQIVKPRAPADGVVFAGRQPMDLLVDAERADGSTVKIVAMNSLVVTATKPVQLAGLVALADGESRVAIADPSLAPAGQYAREALQSANAWDGVQGRLVPTLNVRSALAALSTGSVDFAIVYATDALTEPGLSVVLTIDPALHKPVVYPAAAIPGSKNAAAAERFFKFLQTPAVQQIFVRLGFSLN
jgi:molybdate transport system substrate-binding protein